MSLLSSPYLLVSVSFSSKTGVSMAFAPWRSNTFSITCAGKSRLRVPALQAVPLGPTLARYQAGLFLESTINRPRQNTQRG